MKPSQAADWVFDAALAAGVVFIVAFVWTLSMIFLQAIATCGIVAFIAGVVAQRLDQPTRPVRPVRVDGPAPRQDIVSEEEYDETPIRG